MREVRWHRRISGALLSLHKIDGEASGQSRFTCEIRRRSRCQTVRQREAKIHGVWITHLWRECFVLAEQGASGCVSGAGVAGVFASTRVSSASACGSITLEKRVARRAGGCVCGGYRCVGCTMRCSTGCCWGASELCDPCASGCYGGDGWSDAATPAAGVGGAADLHAVAESGAAG